MSDVFQQAQGRWLSILPALGVGAEFLTGRNGPCPMCQGRDRFRFTNHEERGCYICNQCSRGDGFELLCQLKGWTMSQATTEVKAILGIAKADPVKPAQDEKRQRAERTAIWTGAHRLEGVDAVRRWLVHSLGYLPSASELRGTDELYHPLSRRRFPAMLARVLSPEGKAVQIHRTYLTAAGRKAEVEEPRLLMKAIVPGEMDGGAVRLGPPVDGRLGIAEGIETALAASRMFGIPTWAALNAGNLRKWVAPAGVAVTIFGDNDSLKMFDGQSAAYDLARRLAKDGIQVDDVLIPSGKGEDWKDVLRATTIIPDNDDDRSEQAA